MGMGPDGYWSPREILGYNCQYNFVLSDRGRGKSYGTKLFLIQQPGSFMCLYRTQPDMMSAAASWLDTLIDNDYPADQFEFQSDKHVLNLIYQGDVKGYFRCLSEVNHIKQEAFPNTLDWIWFDEFIPLAYRRIAGVPSEGDAIRAIVKTVDHDTAHPRESKGLRPVRVLLYANPFTWDNPILRYFHISPRYGIHRVGPGVVCEMLEPLDATTGVDAFLGDEVNRNQGWILEQSYIADPPPGAEPERSIRVGRNYYVVSKSKDLLYVKPAWKHRPIMKGPHLMNFGSLEGLQEKEWCLERYGLDRAYMDAIARGMIRFSDVNTKFAFISDMQSCQRLRSSYGILVAGRSGHPGWRGSLCCQTASDIGSMVAK